MNPRYLFLIEGRTTNLIDPLKVTPSLTTYFTDFIPVEWGGYKILTSDGTEVESRAVIYDEDKRQIANITIDYGEYYPFTTLYPRARYVRLILSKEKDIMDYYFGQEETFDSWLNNIVRPVWGNDVTIEFAKESQEEFFRRKLSGRLTFLNEDYTYIKSKAIDYKFQMRVWISYDNGVTWADYWKGHFYWTDCEFDEDSKYIRVTPAVDDEYNDILAGLEKEYNLIDLEPEIFEINVKKRPVIQIVYAGTDGYLRPKAGCFKVDGTYWERDCNVIHINNVQDFVDSYKFNLASGLVQMYLAPQGAVPSHFPTELREMFRGHGYDMGGRYEYALRYQYGNYRIEYNFEDVELTITDLLNNRVLWKDYLSANGTPQTVESKVAEYGDLTVTMTINALLFSRLIFDKSGVEGATTIPSSDVMQNNENYRYCLQNFDVVKNIYYTETYSTTPTKWGKHDPTHYWITPPETSVLGWSPIAMSTWGNGNIAYWFGYSDDLLPAESTTMADAPLKNAYKISDCIKVLLKKIAPDITLAASTFLAGSDPITGDARTFFLTPKTNIKKIDYEIPAMNAPIMLKDIFDMLREGYRVYWYIENNELHIEHISYFLNGHSYDPAHLTYDMDLTERVVPRNGKAWAFALNKYTFDKPDLTDRYEFGWMDGETLPFNGEPINIVGGFVEKGKIQKVSITKFSSDVDFILMNPEDVADEGFVLMGAVYSNGSWSLAFKEFPDMDYVRLQNAYCAFVYMQQYYLYDLPSTRYRIGEGDIHNNAIIKKFKSQEVSFPCLYDPDMKKLVKTSIGNGQFEKLSINLSSRNGKATLKYEPQ